MDKDFSNYDALIKKVDDFNKRVLKKFPDEITCKKKCSSCCEKVLTFFPVEFFSIVDYIEKSGMDRRLIRDNVTAVIDCPHKTCPFLDDGECVVYERRPIICRTFGLPSVVAGGENVEISVCEKNFKGRAIEIEKEYLLNLNMLNSMLAIVNMAFVNTQKGIGNKNDRLSVMEIVKYI